MITNHSQTTVSTQAQHPQHRPQHRPRPPAPRENRPRHMSRSHPRLSATLPASPYSQRSAPACTSPVPAVPVLLSRVSPTAAGRPPLAFLCTRSVLACSSASTFTTASASCARRLPLPPLHNRVSRLAARSVLLQAPSVPAAVSRRPCWPRLRAQRPSGATSRAAASMQACRPTAPSLSDGLMRTASFTEKRASPSSGFSRAGCRSLGATSRGRWARATSWRRSRRPRGGRMWTVPRWIQ